MDYFISDADVSQLDSLEELERRCFSLPWTRQQLESQLHDKSHEFITATGAQGEMLGYVGMMHVLDEGYISNVAVAPEHRREGIGERLIEQLLFRCHTLDLSFVTLEVRAGNVPAIGLYSKLGFIPVGLRKDYYERPREDAVLMTIFLKRGNELEDIGI